MQNLMLKLLTSSSLIGEVPRVFPDDFSCWQHADPHDELVNVYDYTATSCKSNECDNPNRQTFRLFSVLTVSHQPEAYRQHPKLWLNQKKTDFGWFSLTIMTLVGTFCCKSPARIMATCAPQQEPHDASDFVGHREDHPIAQCLGAW